MTHRLGKQIITCAFVMAIAALSAEASLPSGSLNDPYPSLVYNVEDGSLSIDTGSFSQIYDVVVYSDYGIFWPDYATGLVWYANDYQVATLTGQPIYDGDYIGDPGFMYEYETESFLLGDLTFGFAIDAFGQLYGGDLVYYEPTTEIDGDLDGDGFVGITDLNIILGAWNQNVPPAPQAADPSGDGFVGINDLNIVLGNWNAGTPSAATVPEPASLAVLSLLAAGGLLRRTSK